MQAFDRGSWQGRIFELVLAACAFLWAAPAAAEGPPQGEIVVAYSGPRDCSSAKEFIQRASPRLPGLRLVEQGREVGLEVNLARQPDGVSAELVIHLETGGTLSRSILASSCDEAIEAIAFVASVALDPGAQKPVVVQSAGPAADDQAARSATDSERSASAARAREGEGESAGSDASRRRGRSGETGGRGLLGVGVALGFGVAPGVQVGPDLSLGWSSERPGAWSPALVLRAQYLLLEGYEQPAGLASFHLGRGGLELCPSSFRLGILSGRPCLGLAGGWVRSQGSDTIDAGEATRPYFDANLGGQLQVALGRQSAMVLSGYVGIPWIRDSYRFDMAVFHRTAAVTGGLGLSIGARLW